MGVASPTVAAVNVRGSSYFCGYLLVRLLAVQDRDRDTTFARMAILTAARCQVALLIHWPVVRFADGARTVSEKCTPVEPRLSAGVSELQKVLREACVDC
jgi:hypothetical protein